MRSALEIFDLRDGAVTTVLESDRLIEAPNWTPDGAALIVNGEGRLFRVPLDAPRLDEIDTGLSRLNNDHGISPDGSTLALSDHTDGQPSRIYLAPASGGDAVRVTEKVPSWWHGWSPDGERLAYTAVRDEQFCIATCALDGTDERVVIGGPHHYDGPDYTPDGRWIWFNSDRGGAMQLWRVRPDGADAEQMSDDERVNWFPHTSPDGALVVYLAYEPGTEGHPRDCEVELRLMSAAGGAPVTLVQLFGGQGTINVPSWAPDSRRFAFMRYARP